MSSVPPWYPDPGESKPAPMPLLRVQALLNTWDAETQIDLLDNAETAREWLVASGLLDVDSPLRPADLAAARKVRDSIRTLLLPASEGSRHEARVGPLQELARTRQPHLTIDDQGLVTLEGPRRDGLADGLFDLLLIIRAAQEEGTWSRLKACSNPECGWVFYDRSRNQQGSWCDMTVCGNRLKNRRFRARRR